jgi:sugar lactone lactonase YvrE
MNKQTNTLIDTSRSEKRSVQPRARFPLANVAMKIKGLLLTVTALGVLCTAVNPSFAQSIYAPYTFTTLAGLAGSPGSADGANAAARFDLPTNVRLDGTGNLFVADFNNNTIRKVTPSGLVTTMAGTAGQPGSADGTNGAARFNGPNDVVLDSADNLYVADFNNNTIRKVTPIGTNWVVTTLAGCATCQVGSADGTNSAARFNQPNDVALDSAGNLYVADYGNSTIRKLTPVGPNWVVTTLAGLAGTPGSADGTNSAARFYNPGGVAVDSTGNLYVGDTGNSTIRKLTPVGPNWVVTTLAGLALSVGNADGTNLTARFHGPVGVALDGAGSLYVADDYNDMVRKVTPVGTNWVVTSLGGSASSAGSASGTGSGARFNQLEGVAVDSTGNLYVADTFNDTIRKGIPASSVPVPTLHPPSLSAGQFGFGITGLPGLELSLEYSYNLSQWAVLRTFALQGGSNYYSLPTPLQGNRFWRVVVR